MKKAKRQIKYLVVLGIVFDKNKRILLTKRHDPKHPLWHNKWQSPGGTVEFGEKAEQALIREVKEETGVKIKILTNRPIIENNIWKIDNKEIQVTILAYPVLYLSGNLQTTDNETSEVKWFSYQEIDFSKCLPKTKATIDQARKLYL